MKYFQAHSWWKIPEAIAYATSKGLATKMEDGNLFIELKFFATNFQIDGISKVYAGYKHLMNDWNGWEQPYFDRPEMERVVADYMKGVDNDDKDATRFFFEGEENIKVTGEYEEDNFYMEPEMIDVDGKQILVYYMNIGWVWEQSFKKIRPRKVKKPKIIKAA
jgi:hypothetical protein